MIKLVYGIRRRADVSEEEFHRYWLEEHGPLVKSVAKDIGAIRYVQSHTVAPELNAAIQAGRGFEEAYDGITEVWYESLETMQGNRDDPARREAARKLAEDEAKFVDFARSRVFMTEEHEIFDFTG
jgi:uncharacterized protein (TIGR02118 family)